MKMQKELIVKKVMSKINPYSVIEAGVKDWIAGVGLALTTALTGIGEASAEAADLHKHLDQLEKKIQVLNDKNPSKNKSLGIQRNKKQKGPDSFVGNFKITLGPYALEGNYNQSKVEEGGGKRLPYSVWLPGDLKIKIKSDPNASEEEKYKWGKTTQDIKDKLEKEFSKP